MSVLRVKSGGEKGKVYEIGTDNILLGRDRGGGVQILDQGVSRRHAEIFRIGELFFIRDLGSRNGTFVNSEKVSEVVLRFGDQVQIGNTTLVFEDRLAHLRDSQLIVVDDDGDGGANGKYSPSSTLQLKLTDTIAGKLQPPTPEEQNAESRRLAALVGVSQIIGAERDLSKILNKAAQQVGKAVDADNVFIFHVKEGEDDNNLAFKLLGRYDRSEDTHNEGVSRSIIRDCLRHRRAVLTSDAGLDARFHATASVVMQRIKSVICVPIAGLGRNLGVLYISNAHRAEAFGAEDLELAMAVGIQLGTIIQLLKIVQRSDEMFRNSVRTLVKAVEMREASAEGRSQRIAAMCLAIAKELDWSTHECRNGWAAGMLFDIGSIPLSDRDRKAQFSLDTRKNHYATQLLSNMPGLEEILPALIEQKEHWDGSGSPDGKKGEAIAPLALILGLAREFDQLLRHGGADGGPLPEKEALLKASKFADVQFPAETVNALLLAYRRGSLFEAEEVSFFEMPQ